MAIRWRHFADILFSVEAVLGEQYVRLSGLINVILSSLEIYWHAIFCMYGECLRGLATYQF